jgi:hypothetical protein
MPHYASAWFILAAALTLPVLTAHAVPLIFTANLSGANELSIAVPSPGMGAAIVTLDPIAQTLQINAVVSGLTLNVTMEPVHCCAPFGTVAAAVPAVPGFPLGGTSGSYSSLIFDLTTQSVIYNPAFITLTSAPGVCSAGAGSGRRKQNC